MLNSILALMYLLLSTSHPQTSVGWNLKPGPGNAANH